MNSEIRRAFAGCLLGGAVGDALGLPFEGLTRPRLLKICRRVDRHHFLFGHGMVSDDTEHACMTAQALIVAGGDVNRFSRSLAWRLRGWLLGIPAGIGFATLRSIIKLWVGFPPERSGVFSAGNGPAMRAPIIGVAYAQDVDTLKRLVEASTRLTHTDPKAYCGALAIALASAHLFKSQSKDAVEYLKLLRHHLIDTNEGPELVNLVEQAVRSVDSGETPAEFADRLGQYHEVTGYMYHTVPLVLHACFRHCDDYRPAVQSIIACGGDTDTTAAIVGGILGARIGPEGLPPDWLEGLLEWPRSRAWMRQLAGRLAESLAARRPEPALPLFFPVIPVRNFTFLIVVLIHGFRRLAPPY